MSTNVFEKINELAVLYSKADNTNDKMKYLDEIFSIFFGKNLSDKLSDKNLKNQICRKYTSTCPFLFQISEEICTKLFFELLEKYDAEKNDNFYNYFKSIFKLRIFTAYKKYVYEHPNLNLPEDMDKNDFLENTPVPDTTNDVIEKETNLFLYIVELILFQKTRDNSKSQKERKTKSKWEYFYNFHTDTSVWYIKTTKNINVLKKNNNKIINSIEQNFLNYIMTKHCTNVTDICLINCKFENDKKDGLIHLPQSVYVDYMNIDKGSVSKMARKYAEYLSENLDKTDLF